MWINACRWAKPRLALLVGDELRGTDRRKVERHLIGCDDCQVRLQSLRSAMESLRYVAFHAHESATLAKAPSLWPALARQIRESKHSEPVPFTLRPIWMGLGMAASVLGLAGLANWSLNPGRAALSTASQAARPKSTVSLPLKTSPVIVEASPNSTVADVTPSSHKTDGETGIKESGGNSRSGSNASGRISSMDSTR